MDVRHEPQPIDIDFLTWLGNEQLPFALVFTKADKLKPKALTNKVDHYLEHLKAQWESLPPYFVTSASQAIGLDALKAYIDQVLTELEGLNVF